MSTTEGRIGVFDSGYGGLTILREILREIPEMSYTYLGDNARTPYGTRSFEVVYSYTLEAVRYLMEQRHCPLVIVACNTASAKALRTIQQKDLKTIDPSNRVLGIIRPTAESISGSTITGHVGILATPGTVRSQSYLMEIAKAAPGVRVTQQACPMWVPLVENREIEGEGTEYFVRKYLSLLLEQDPEIDCIVLGCTHYPLLEKVIRKNLPKRVRLISQGSIVAGSLRDYLRRHPEMDRRLLRGGDTEYLTTESTEAFSSLAGLFLEGKTLSAPEHVELPGLRAE